MLITAVTPQARTPSRVNVFVDGEFRLGLPAELAAELGLRKGEPLTEERLSRALDADMLWRAREAALSLLGYRARSAAELRQRLLRKQFPPGIVDQVLEQLDQRGHVDDGAFARAFVRDRLERRPRGRRRLEQELRARGVDAEAASGAVQEALRDSTLSEEDLARRAAEAWLRRAGARARGPDARRRLYAYLGRRGFFGSAAQAAIRAVLPDG